MSAVVRRLPIRGHDDLLGARRGLRGLAASVGWDARRRWMLVTAVSGAIRRALDAGSEAVLEVEAGDPATGAPRLRLRVDGAEALPPVTLPTGAEPACLVAGGPAPSADDELRETDQALEAALAELRARDDELRRTRAELEETNQGVLALYAELEDRVRLHRRSSRFKSQFVSTLSHEFRTPLSAILSLTRLLLDEADGPLVDEQRHQVRLIQQSAESLLRLTNNLLDLARIEAGRMVVEPERFGLQEVFDTVRSVTRHVRRSPSVSLVFEPVAHLPPFETDRAKVGQILRNLVSNALKYTEAGEIRVGARMRDSERVELWVRDTGVGISSEDRERIFEHFVQLRQGQGVGLGLPLTKLLVGLLGGDVELESAPGEGSTFRAVLPIVYMGPREKGIDGDGPDH